MKLMKLDAEGFGKGHSDSRQKVLLAATQLGEEAHFKTPLHTSGEVLDLRVRLHGCQNGSAQSNAYSQRPIHSRQLCMVCSHRDQTQMAMRRAFQSLSL